MKYKLRNRKKFFGAWQSIANPQITEILCKSDVDFLGIDMEHSTVSQAEAQRIISACHENNVLCLPRIASHNEEMVKRLLDSGADGIIAPMVNTAKQAKEISSWCKYPPLGKRSFGIARAQGYGFEFDEYISEWNEKFIFIAQIETIESVLNIEQILIHCDGVMIDTYDLSGSLNVPGQLNHPDVKCACEKVINACKKSMKSCGIQIIEPTNENIKSAFDDGYTFIVMASDVFSLTKWSKDMNETIIILMKQKKME